MLKEDIKWPKHRRYNSSKEWEPLSFFSDCLCNSISFDLSLGFFSSSAIRTLSCSFATFLFNGGKMRLIINNILSQNDKEAILKGEKGEDIKPFDITNISKLKDSLSSYEVQFFECIAWLIANNKIEIIVIEPKGGKGIAHTKSGIFFDGNQYVGFNGSCNFTKTALLENIESIDVHCQWDGPISEARINEAKEEFELRISKQDYLVNYVDPKNIIVSIQSFFEKKDINDLLFQEKKLIENELKDNSAKTSLRPGIKKALLKAQEGIAKIIDEQNKKSSTPCFPYSSGPRDYQQLAFENWKNNGQKGLFAMATGTGKTITSLNCLLEIYKRSKYYKAIILVPTITLIEQWVKECKKFKFRKIVKVYSKDAKWKDELDNIILQEKLEDESTSYVIICTYASFAKEKTFKILNQFSQKRVLLIADEAHNMGAGLIRKMIPDISYGRRIGLSATPERQFDDSGNKAILEFFNSTDDYTYEYSMKEAIDNDVLCTYYYYPHIVKLTNEEMKDYEELSKKIAKYATFEGDLRRNDPILTSLLLKRKRIIHKAENKKQVFRKIIEERFVLTSSLKYTLIYVPEGNQPDDNGDIFYDRETIANDKESMHLIDQYTSIVRDVDKRVTVKQFTSDSKDRDDILEDFASGKLDVLTSMKCLDEGVDVPRSEIAIFCASTGNPRQFIQRRGRILRIHKDKEHAVIHDLVVIPDIEKGMESFNVERKLLEKELERVRNFSSLAENKASSFSELDSILDYYSIPIYN